MSHTECFCRRMKRTRQDIFGPYTSGRQWNVIELVRKLYQTLTATAVFRENTGKGPALSVLSYEAVQGTLREYVSGRIPEEYQ